MQLQKVQRVCPKSFKVIRAELRPVDVHLWRMTVAAMAMKAL
jgi:hypothetical protein